MGDDELRQVIETNFQLMAMSLREASVRAGRMETGLGEVQRGLGEVRALAEENQSGFLRLADQMEETLTALKSLGFGQAETRQQILALQEGLQAALGRIEQLEKKAG